MTRHIQTDNFFNRMVLTIFRHYKPTALCFNFFRTTRKILYSEFHIWHIAFCLTHNSTLHKSQKSKFYQYPKYTYIERKSVRTIFVCFLLLTSATFSCNGTKQTATQKNEKVIQTKSLQATYNISARTRQFLNELEKELSESNKNLKTFSPSKKLIDEFNIKQANERFFINGFIKTNEHFDKTNLEKSGVTFGQPSGQITTVYVPLYVLPDFLSDKGIEYFEISSKVQTK